VFFAYHSTIYRLAADRGTHLTLSGYPFWQW
jgi:hypothetical protein